MSALFLESYNQYECLCIQSTVVDSHTIKGHKVCQENTNITPLHRSPFLVINKTKQHTGLLEMVTGAMVQTKLKESKQLHLSPFW